MARTPEIRAASARTRSVATRSSPSTRTSWSRESTAGSSNSTAAQHDPALRWRPGADSGDLGTHDGLLGGINTVVAGNYLTTLGRDPGEDLALLADLQMPVKALNAAL